MIKDTGHEDYMAAVDEIVKLRNKKQKVYANDWVEMGLDGNFYNIWRKFNRLKNYFHGSKGMDVENLEDTYRDLANYALFGLVLIRKEKAEFEKDEQARTHRHDYNTIDLDAFDRPPKIEQTTVD